MELEIWPLIEALMSWVIVPISAVLWIHTHKIAAHDRDVLRILTLLAERKEQRDEDHRELNESLHDLRAAIQRLDERLATVALIRPGQGATADLTLAAAARRGTD